ncbi:unnamed protein product [marine sediment metagenome]|uniref:Uncharacterized protein n=1 Tax=marine sediment metagenome TaxID=412755 RepID=X1CMN7_9ZZZZ
MNIGYRYVVIHKMDEKWKYQTVSVPKEILKAIKELIAELKYWPSVTSFAREALLEKIRQEKAVLKELRENEGKV